MFLKALFGCESIKRILIYLLINESCYAHRLHLAFGTALTPIQNALSRLERGKILESMKEGKTRLYRFHPDFPFRSELEQLLKKAYNNLPLEERKKYYGADFALSTDHTRRTGLLHKTWKQLQEVTSVSSVTKSHGSEGKRKGSVQASKNGNVIVFQEQGIWTSNAGQTHNYSNAFRWTLERSRGLISLEHLRFGKSHPVFLFHLLPTKSQVFESVDPHLCGEDTYFGKLQVRELYLQLSFRTIGPHKNEKLEYIYT